MTTVKDNGTRAAISAQLEKEIRGGLKSLSHSATCHCHVCQLAREEQAKALANNEASPTFWFR